MYIMLCDERNCIRDFFNILINIWTSKVRLGTSTYFDKMTYFDNGHTKVERNSFFFSFIAIFKTRRVSALKINVIAEDLYSNYIEDNKDVNQTEY